MASVSISSAAKRLSIFCLARAGAASSSSPSKRLFSESVRRVVALPSTTVGFLASPPNRRRRRGGAGLFQNMRFSGSNGDGDVPTSPSALDGGGDDENALKWERMYYAPIGGSLSDDGPRPSSASTTATEATLTTSSKIRVVTFDLDNTIWKTSETISDANNALARHLEGAFGVEERSEKRMGKLFKQFPDRYVGISHEWGVLAKDKRLLANANGVNGNADIVLNGRNEINFPADAVVVSNDKDALNDGVHIQTTLGKGKTKKKPVYLTLLRKDAVRSLIRETEAASGLLAMEVEGEVDSAFDIWMKARCESISRNLAASAVETLMSLSSNLDGAYIGAITDGNSNPNEVEGLSRIFDFVIHAEDVGVSKPDRRVYKAAVAALIHRLEEDGRCVEEFFLGEAMEEGIAAGSYVSPPASAAARPSWRDVEEEAVEAFSEAVGPWWIHVGDDFLKDVVASKEFRMRTVWMRELIGGGGDGADDQGGRLALGGASLGAKERRSPTDLAKELTRSNGVLKMTIGESEFLSTSLQGEFSDAVLDRFSDLGDLLARWHEEGMIDRRAARQSPAVGGGGRGAVATTAANGMSGDGTFRTSGLDVFPRSESQNPMDDLPEDTVEAQPDKYCVFCGSKLPAIAKFCSSCGERQA